MEVNPIALIFVYMDSKGDRLLYRYPYKEHVEGPAMTKEMARRKGASEPATSETLTIHQQAKKRNPYALNDQDPLLQTFPRTDNNPKKRPLQDYDDEVLSTLFATKPQLCNQKFELKVNDVRFVCHPCLIFRKEQQRPTTTEAAVNVGGGGAGVEGSGTSGPTGEASNRAGIAISPPVMVVSAGSSVGSSASAGSINNDYDGSQRMSSPTVGEAATSATSISGSPPSVGNNAPTPLSLQSSAGKPSAQQVLLNIVFALHAQASFSIVKRYHELSKRIGLALKFEEQRCGYVTDETIQMALTHDEVSSCQWPIERAFDLISERSSLAQSLKTVYHELCTNGLLNTTINQFLTLSFCLPQKAHQLHKKGSMVDPEKIDQCLRSLKPYHGMLLLVDFAELLDCVPPTGTRMLLQLIEVYTPLMSLQNMASEADIAIEHVYKLVSHLVYWAKATIIYPLCETNVYVIAPDAPLHTNSHLVDIFSTRFAGMSLFEVIADFSLPTSIGHLTTPLQQSARQGILAQMVLWMLQHHLLVQLHTYVQFMPIDGDDLEGDNACISGGVGVDISGDNVRDSSDSLCENFHEIRRTSARMPESRKSEINPGSLLSVSSQPLPVPNSSTEHNTNSDDHYSGDGSTISDNIIAQPSSSHKSNFSMTASISTENCESVTSLEDEEKIKDLLQVFEEYDRAAIRRIPASMNVEDLSLMVKLYQAGYFKSEHHLEEIMYFENLRRSQLLQLLDKFRDVLIIYETEDPAIASMYTNK